MKSMYSIKLSLSSLMFVALVYWSGYAAGQESFQPTAESLKQYKCPEWFRDAKLGIYTHWGPSAVAAADDWYARHMYIQGHPAYNFHVKTFGHPSEFGYKDLIRLWKAERFDPDRLVKLFKEAGAKYVSPVAVHHDNFDLWDSKHHRFNAAKMGPKKDLIGMWRKATLKHGLRFGVTTHFARTYSWFNTNKGADTTGPLAGVPYDGNDPEFRELYLGKHDDSNVMAPLNPPRHVREKWAARTKDLIDRYAPDVMYFDGAIPFRGEDQFKTGMEVIAHYYNQSIQRHGKLDSVMFTKDIDHHFGKHSHGLYVEGATSLDMERTLANDLREDPWQTDDSIGPWFYIRGAGYTDINSLVRKFVDIVTKNGCLLLNVPLRADGTLDEAAEALLVDLGKWTSRYGQSIYETRPGPFYPDRWGGSVHKGKLVYLHVLNWGGDEELTLPPLDQKVLQATALTGGDVEFEQDADRIAVRMKKADQNDVDTIIRLEMDTPVVEMAKLRRAPSPFESGHYGRWLSRDATYEMSSRVAEWSTDEKSLLNGEAYEKGFAFHTDQELNPSIVIDLGREAGVKGVEIINREDGGFYNARARSLTVWISRDKKTWKQVWKATDAKPVYHVKLVRRQGIPTGQTTRYIKIGLQQDTAEYLHLKSIRIYGE